MKSKSELLQAFLEERGLFVPQGFGEWHKVSCFNDAAHPRGDRNPSASVNLRTGRYRCFACDLGGDVYDLLYQLEGLDYPAARARLGVEGQKETREETWI